MVEQKILELDNSTLEGIIRGGTVIARQAFEELSGRALGGNSEAKLLVNQLDTEFSSGVLTLPAEEVGPTTKTSDSGLIGKLKGVFGLASQTEHLLPPDRDP